MPLALDRKAAKSVTWSRDMHSSLDPGVLIIVTDGLYHGRGIVLVICPETTS